MIMFHFIKMSRSFTALLLLFFSSKITIGQSKISFVSKIDSLIYTNLSQPFNGSIKITQHGKILYLKAMGIADIESKKSLNLNNQFVIGSISKQFTAILLLQLYDKGKVQLHIPIRIYLPNLTQKWADSVTIHQLLTHTHGIISLEKPLSFKAGTQYSYSQIGYDLLAQIIENVSNKSFVQISNELFMKHGMKNTFHPNLKKYKYLVKGYTEQNNGKLTFETETFENYAAAGGFISTVGDLSKWNEILYSGKLIKPETYKMMISKQPVATRQHPIFGKTDYGYGITVDNKEGLLQFGQTGFTPGFISMSFYFPKTQTSVVVLDNFVWNSDDLNKAFFYHLEILKIIREMLKP